MSNNSSILERLKTAVINGDEQSAIAISGEALNSGVDVSTLVNKGLNEAMNEVGMKFARLEIFLTQMMMAANAMKAAFKVLQPVIEKNKLQAAHAGRVVIGTVKGDIHDIGKTIVATLLESAGFEVFDLGVDVPSMSFIDKAIETKADIIASSALLTTTTEYQKEIIDLLKELGLRDKFKVMVGGGPVTPELAKEIGADGYGQDPWEAVKVAKELVAQTKRKT
jgi:corrinoid protein of di/trimethylamine methyltransferase